MKTPIPSQARKMIASAGIAVILTGASMATSAASKTVTLAIPSMDCPVCPITVKKALSQVPGVSQTDVNFERRQVVVTFDDAKSNVGALTESTRNAGYPSTAVGTAN
jgi:mercuric ion binding protein